MNSGSRDNFKETVRRALAARVGGRCSSPTCGALTTGPQSDPARAVNLGVAAHITAASPGGPRFDSSLTSEQRGGPENGIWLCQNCAKLVDNDDGAFSVAVLKEWKAQAETYASRVVGRPVPSASSAPARHARVLFVENRLILPANESTLLRLTFGLMNAGNLDAVFRMWDRTYFFTVDPAKTVFPYGSSPVEQMPVAALPNAIWRGELRFELSLTHDKLEALRNGKARLFFYARGEYADSDGKVTPLSLAEMYDTFFPGNLVAPPANVRFE